MLIRLATIQDVPEIANLFVAVLTETPFNQVVFANCGEVDYRRYREEKLAQAIVDKRRKVVIAVDEVDGQILGVVVYLFCSMEAQGFEEERQFEHPKFPEGTDLVVMIAYMEKLDIWMEEKLKSKGPHIKGETMNVIRGSRNVGVGTELCKAVAKDAEEFKIPVFFDTTFYSIPFYERFADMQGYRVKYYGHIHHRPGAVAVSSYLVQLVQAPPKKPYRFIYRGDSEGE